MAIVITPSDLGSTLNVVGGKVEVQYAAPLQKDASGKLAIDPASLAQTPISAGASQPAFLAIVPSGTDNHTITITPNWTDPAFVEAVQDAVGQAIMAAAGGTLTYDDVANTIATTLGNLGFPMSVKKDAATGAVTLENDQAAPGNSMYYGTNAAGVKGWNALPPSGVSSDTGNYLVNGTDGKPFLGANTAGLVNVTDLAGNHLFYGMP